MDNHPAPAFDPATAHNDARLAARKLPTMNDEATAAAAELASIIEDMVDWLTSVIEIKHAEPSERTSGELWRLVHKGSMVGEAITKARAHTREASRLSQQSFPLPDQD